MIDDEARRNPPKVLVLADVESNGQALIERVLRPAGINAWTPGAEGPEPEILVVDVTQLRGEPLAGLRGRRALGDEAPAIVLAAHFPPARLRELFRLGVEDVLIKPYRPGDLVQAILDLSENRPSATTTRMLTRRLEAAREQARRRTEEIRLLSQIGRAVVSLTDIDQILTHVVEAAAFVTDAEEAAIYLAEPGTDEVLLRASKQPETERATLERLRISDTLAGEVYRTGRPVVRQPSIEGERVKVQTGFLVRALVKVPLRVRDRVVGVLGVYNRMAARPFHEHHVTVLMALATWAGVALESAAGVRAQPKADQAPRPRAYLNPVIVQENVDRAAVLLESLRRSELGRLTEGQLETIRSVERELGELWAWAKEAIDRAGIYMQDLLEEVAARFREQAVGRGLELQVTCDGDFPALNADPVRLRQALEGLVSASLHRTSSGRISLQGDQLEVVAGKGINRNLPPGMHLKDGRWVTVTVSDTGAKLSWEVLRALTTSRADPQVGRLGPGLSLGEVRLMIEGLGGAVWYQAGRDGPRITLAIPAGPGGRAT
jgi:DNA-binding NarL/FixJ family response regulator